MLVSGNDAALAVAHCVSGSVEEFVELMNGTAQRLGMEHSHFPGGTGSGASFFVRSLMNPVTRSITSGTISTIRF